MSYKPFVTVSALFGAVGRPLAYYRGARLGATDALPTTIGILLLAIGWRIMTPLLVWLARVFSSNSIKGIV